MNLPNSEPNSPADAKGDGEAIRIDNLHKSFGDLEVLKGVSLSAKKGDVVAIIGGSGSGKSTLLNLIPRIYDIETGDILIDNQSISKVTIKSLRKEISMVSQETTLFDDTIKNNIQKTILLSSSNKS